MKFIMLLIHQLQPSYFLTGVEIQNASGWGDEFPDEENLGF